MSTKGCRKELPFRNNSCADFVKLTYGIVKDIGRALAASEKAEAINQKCHALGIKTIAEYVESREVLEHLRLVEVDFAQGLIVSAPQRLA